MINFSSVKKSLPSFSLMLLFVALITIQGCKKKRSDMANQLFKATKNKVYKDATPEAFTEVFKTVLDSEKSKMVYPQYVTSYYSQNDYDAAFVMDHLFNNDLSALTAHLKAAGEHGIDPKLYRSEQIDTLIARLKAKKGVKTINEAYHDMAELEMLSADAMIGYSNALQFGMVNPSKIFSRYFMQTALPDSANTNKIFAVQNIKLWLDSIQPKSPQYVALQKALASGVSAEGLSKEETRRMLLVNMERLRWKNKPSEKKYVWVNVADYHLDVIDSGKSVLGMKVCVGEGRNKNNVNTLEKYNDSCKTDKPYRKETPLLSSLIHSVQVNPIWNIPESIVSREIVKQASDDKFYLKNKNINVYKNGKQVDSDDIDWSKVAKDNSDYEFKQQPGADNSLGKIKFLFNNKSSVYLHDTPAKLAFNLAERDVSHGCVRLEKPLDLAHNLFGDSNKYQTIAKDMGEDNPNPEDIRLSPKVPVYITYVTCWADESGTLQFRKDVYGLDIVLFDHLKKYLVQ